MTDTNNNKVMAVLCYIGILWVIPLITEHKNDPFVKFHINQGIILTIFGLAVRFAAWVIGFIKFLSAFISGAGWILIVIFAIIGIINAINMEKKPMPLIGTLFTIYK